MGGAVAFFGMLLIERGASTEFRTRPIYVHTYFIRRPAAECATPKPYGNLTRLSPRVRVWRVRLPLNHCNSSNQALQKGMIKCNLCGLQMLQQVTYKCYLPIEEERVVASFPGPPLQAWE